MVSRRWYPLPVGAAIWGGFALLPENLRDGTVLTETVDAWIGAALPVSWLAMPAALYLDWRAIRDRVAWSPSVPLWCLLAAVWLANVPTAIAYVVRRDAALRADVPGAGWYRGVQAGLGVWIALVAADAAEDAVSLGSVDDVLFGPLLMVGLLGYPAATYLDLAHVRGYADWTPTVRLWVAASAIPLVNVLVGLGYLFKRRRAFAATDDPDALSLPGGEGSGGTAKESTVESPWFRRAVGLFVVHFALVLLIAAGTDLSETGLEILAVALWLPFGLAFAATVYFDLAAITDQGVEWGPTRHLYLLSAVIHTAALFYLLRRYGIVRRAESRRSAGASPGDADGSDAGERTGDEGDESDEADRERPPDPLAGDPRDGGGATASEDPGWALDSGSGTGWDAEGDGR